ncbi:acyl-[ACP]--phospholipid O-acyltransferase [Oceanicoccus sagamiensis]|uniref:Acyl-[ACP]--phospholipid O-acyltransferase n=1 Tax=Oceanicoccus sagamiensis TaxID=716816 RepID=A0A1X9N7D4_9GAMM|nr:acyl-[ACP]--phospholipid O-acyltransferase [Oceanicoccus sagamiensis]ARN73044.1 acyl-[ACP]--phospholipid O-acyltransferase [Oceanicoccus sagamiensis]
MKKLFSIPGVTAYLIVVFLNAFVDLGHKITIQNTIFKVYDGNTQIIYAAIINSMILLPFILLFSPAGIISDRYAKEVVMRLSAWAAVAITLGITCCYYMGWFWPAFGLTFLLAIQSAIYSPAKYGYIKTLFGKQHLAEGNGLVQATTIFAMLFGTFVFSVIFESLFPKGSDTNSGLMAVAPIGWLLVLNSIIELIMAYRLPLIDRSHSDKRLTAKALLNAKSMIDNIKPVTRNRVIRLSVIGIAIFWSVGQVMLAAFSAFAKETLAIDNTIIIQGIMAFSGLGIAIGSTLAGKWSKGHIETGLVPIGAAGIGLGLLLLPQINSAAGHFANFLFIGIMGGLFIVPLNALIQFTAKENELGTVIAGNNLIQNISMLSFLIITVLFAIAGIDSKILLTLIAIVAMIGGFYTIYQLPQSLVRFLIGGIMSRRYKIDVQGVRNIPSQGGVLLLGNHISWIDWAIIQIASPRPIRFVMFKDIYERWYLKGFFKLGGCIPIDSTAGSHSSLKTVASLLDNGEIVCLFPEGSISRTGHLGEFRRGYELACKRVSQDIVIIPFYLRGLWGSQFSHSSEKLKTIRSKGRFRELIVAFGSPLPKDTGVDILKRRVFDLSIEAWQQHVNDLPSLPHAWIDTVKRVGSEMAIADTSSEPLSATQALCASIAFSKRIKTHSSNTTIGLLLPTSAGGMIANMAGLLAGKTIVNLNYSASESTLQSAVQQADISTIFTSRLFLEKLAMRDIHFKQLLEHNQVVYLEDLKSTMTKYELLRLWLTVKLLPASGLRWLYSRHISADQTAAILFSSGSEGAPKGVMLSHRNIMANLKQISDVLNTQDSDVVMASLPLFHAFGLTVTQFMPLIEGLPVVCHADPTDAPNIGKAVAHYKATIICGTSTFLRLYTKNRKVHPLMFDSLRIVVAGAEKLNEQVRESFQLKFNKTIYEGYGATETTPVASVNLPDALDTDYWEVQTGGKIGTVGMPLPGTSFKIIDPDTEAELDTGEEGMIIIGGSQIMQGYLKLPEKTDDVIRTIDGQRWYITGDKGRIDKDGFLTIIDRYSRFAKIAGEMVGLGNVEQNVKQALKTMGETLKDDAEVLAVNIPDANKGERIVLLTTVEIDSSTLKKTLLDARCNALAIPAQILLVEDIPKLGSGKTDFSQAKILAAQ